MTSKFVAGALSVPLLFGTLAVAAPAVAEEIAPETAVTTVEPAPTAPAKVTGKATKKSKPVAPKRGKSPHKFGTIAYNKWYAKHYMAYKYKWGDKQFAALEKLWTRESGWSQHAHNGGSGAHGIPQSLPGSKMASHGPNWRSNPETQIKWGLSYIKGRYSTPIGAWNAFQHKGWY
jgi:hypothetical protein